MLRFSLPLVLSSLALIFAAYGDRIILRSTLGFQDLGIYGIGARLAAVITLVINGFQLGAAPLIYRHYDEPSTPAALAQLMRLFLAACLVGVVGLAAVLDGTAVDFRHA
jgi:O-antigen/teichoic acid export membrane protein